MSDALNKIVEKVTDSLISVKFFVILVSTWLFYVSKLNQDGWITMVLSVTGMRVMNEVAAMYKEIRTAQVPAPKEGPQS